MGALATVLWTFIRVFGSWLIRWAGPWVLQALAFFGLSFLAQKFVMTPFITYIHGMFSGLPAVLYNALAGVGIDQAFTIILSAYAVAVGGKLLLRRKAGA